MKSLQAILILFILSTPLFSQKVIKKNGVTIVIAEKDTTKRTVQPSDTVVITDKSDDFKLSCTSFYSKSFGMKNPLSLSYNRTLSWINRNYYNPDFVIKGNVNNNSINFTGNSVFYQQIGVFSYVWRIKYSVVINFLNDNCLFNIELQEISHTCQEVVVKYSFLSYMYNQNCKLKYTSNEMYPVIEKWLNNFYQNLKSEINNKELTSDEAISRIKELKELFDLEIISKENFEKEKSELLKFIKK